jgi:acetyl-CoA acetyltransferase
VNRLCGSGIEAIAQAAQRLLLGESELVLAAAWKNMTQAPFVIRGLRHGLKLGGGALEDTLMVGLTDTYLRFADGADRGKARRTGTALPERMPTATLCAASRRPTRRTKLAASGKSWFRSK